MDEPKRIHQKAYHHIKRHKKNYVRIVAFFTFLIIYSVIEDMIAMAVHGVDFDLITVFNVFVIAMVFTGIAEVTERLYKKEEPKIEGFIKKEENALENEERTIEKKIKQNL